LPKGRARPRCSQDGCGRPHYGHGWCNRHYAYWRKHGVPEPPSRKEQFWALVDRSGGPDACHPWTGGRSPKGYGVFRIYDRAQRTHRIAWRLTCGPIPPGISVLHRCDNPPCCNPDHLWLGTNGDNNIDRTQKGRSADQRKTHCKRGHALIPPNLIRQRNRQGGWGRKCRQCHNDRARSLRAARRGAS
jgi:hypothetical protein